MSSTMTLSNTMSRSGNTNFKYILSFFVHHPPNIIDPITKVKIQKINRILGIL